MADAASALTGLALDSSRVAVRLDGLTCLLRVRPCDTLGMAPGEWAVLSLDGDRVAVTRPATARERSESLAEFPAVRAVVTTGAAASTHLAVRARAVVLVGWGWPAQPRERPVLAEREVRPLAVVVAREIGRHLYVEREAESRPAARAAACWLAQQRRTLDSERVMRGIHEDLGRAGAVLIDVGPESLIDGVPARPVQWRVASGKRLTTWVDRARNVLRAGCCVSGHDRDFDLTSLALACARGR